MNAISSEGASECVVAESASAQIRRTVHRVATSRTLLRSYEMGPAFPPRASARGYSRTSPLGTFLFRSPSLACPDDLSRRRKSKVEESGKYRFFVGKYDSIPHNTSNYFLCHPQLDWGSQSSAFAGMTLIVLFQLTKY